MYDVCMYVCMYVCLYTVNTEYFVILKGGKIAEKKGRWSRVHSDRMSSAGVYPVPGPPALLMRDDDLCVPLGGFTPESTTTP